MSIIAYLQEVQPGPLLHARQGRFPLSAQAPCPSRKQKKQAPKISACFLKFAFRLVP